MSAKPLPALARAVRYAQEYLGELDDRPVASTATLEELRTRLGGPVPEVGKDASQVVEHLVNATEGGLLGPAGGRFYASVIGGALESAVAANWLTSSWDQNAALYTCGRTSIAVV
jgi:hypothetical protein